MFNFDQWHFLPLCIYVCVGIYNILPFLLWLCFPPVFECMYAELVLPWYHVPEPCESQPLHQALSREFDCVIERVVRRARDFDVCEAVVGSIRILTLHLHNAKHSDR